MGMSATGPRRPPTGRAVRLGLLALATLLAGCGGGPQGRPPKEVARWKVPPKAQCVAFSPDGKVLAVGCGVPGPAVGHDWEGAVEVYDLATEKQLARLPLGRWVRCLAFSADGKYLAAGTGIQDNEVTPQPGYADKPGELVVYETGKYAEAFRHTSDKAPSAVRGVAFAPKGGVVYATVAPNRGPAEVRAWTVPGFKGMWAATEPQAGQFTGLAVDPGGEKVYIADHEFARAFATDTGRHLGNLRAGGRDARLSVSADGRRLLSAPPHSSTHRGLLDLREEKAVELSPFTDGRGKAKPAEVATLSPDGGRIARHGLANEYYNLYYVGVWDIQSGAKACWEYDGIAFLDLGFSPDGKRLAACGAGTWPDAFAVVWEVPELK